MLKSYLPLLILTLAFKTANAVQPVDRAPDPVAIIGTGQFSCGKFIEYREQGDPQQLNVIVQWVWGFTSAYNVRGNFGPSWQRVSHLPNIPDSPTVLLELDKYCRKHPLDNVMAATFSMISDLGGAVVWSRSKP